MNTQDILQQALSDIDRRAHGGACPALNITWKPWGDDQYQIRYVDVALGLESPAIAAGETLVSLWVEIASIPCSVFTEAGLTAMDADGPLPLSVTVERDAMGFNQRHWRPLRATQGHVALTYRFYPRVVPPDYRFRPYYDFRCEPLGATAAGVASLVSAPDREYDIHIHWDLSEMPPDTRAAGVYGEGDAAYIGRPSDYQFTFYAVGKLKSRHTEDGRFSVYWLAEPLPDADRVLDAIPKILRGMADFFEDDTCRYSVFFRKDPFRMSNGATACQGGFIYGYSDEKPLNLDVALDIFAHEVVHTWPRIEDKAGEGTWYHEGTAELYSILIPYRMGITTLHDVARQIAWRGYNYYNNPYRETPNTDIFPLYWGDRKAQTLPYGRGFFYLAQVDMRIHAKSGGTRRLDDLVLALERRRRAGERLTRDDWRALILAELGQADADAFDAVCAGQFIPPDPAWFDGAFDISRGEVFEPVREFREEGYLWQPKPGVNHADL